MEKRLASDMFLFLIGHRLYKKGWDFLGLC